jgi:transcriptional regulator with XRE-family HTH domain
MSVSKKRQIENIRKNIDFAIRQRGDSKKSFSECSGVTRTTIYNILNGNVDKIHDSTIDKIATYLETSIYSLKNEDLEQKDIRSHLISVDGNKNPVAVPIMNELEFVRNIHKYIGEMIVSYPVTYHFSDGKDIVAVRVEDCLSKRYTKGNILIINRTPELKKDDHRDKLILQSGLVLNVLPCSYILDERERLLGVVVEERVRG